MSVITIQVEVPDNLDSTVVQARAVEESKSAINEMERRQRQEECAVAVLESDEALAQWIRDEGWTTHTTHSPASITRASTYKKVAWNQELWGGPHLGFTNYALKNVWERNPRRPVFMRGCHGRLIYIHSASTWGGKHGGSANNWCVKVALRYIGIKHVTSLSSESHQNIAESLISSLNEKYCTSYHFSDKLYRAINAWPRDFTSKDCGGNVHGYCVWVNGRETIVNQDQLSFLRKMYSIIGKFDNVNDRMAELRRYRQEQLREAA